MTLNHPVFLLKHTGENEFYGRCRIPEIGVEKPIPELSLHEKHVIANMDEMGIAVLEAIVERYVEGKGGNRAIGHHHVLTIQPLFVSGQVWAQDLAVWVSAGHAILFDHHHAVRRADQFWISYLTE
jgi:hypothetical protein